MQTELRDGGTVVPWKRAGPGTLEGRLRDSQSEHIPNTWLSDCFSQSGCDNGWSSEGEAPTLMLHWTLERVDLPTAQEWGYRGLGQSP